MQKFRVLGLVYLTVYFTLSGLSFAEDYPQLKLPLRKISFCGRAYRAWVAKTEEDKTRGLMSFRPLENNEAMLFIFSEEAPRAFWMKNVPYDLDIAYFDQKRRLVSSLTMKGTSPLMKQDFLPNYPSSGDAMYAVEVKAGTLKKLPKDCKLSF